MDFEKFCAMLNDSNLIPEGYDKAILGDVYFYHPALKGKNPMKKLVTLYKIGGMVLIKDMYKRAEKIRELRAQISQLEVH